MSDLHGKKLLILAGNNFHAKIVKAAKALGVYTIVTDYLLPEESPAKLVADEYWMLSTGDIDAVVDKCREEHVDGVLSYCIDTVQFHYFQICEKLGFPCYGTKRQFEIMTNKRLFKDFCIANDVDVIPEYTLDDVNNNKVTYPVLVKPSDSRGSRGQTVCMCKEEIEGAIKKAVNDSKDGGFLIERYMSGAHDMACTYMVIDKQPYMVKICDRHVGKKDDQLDRQQIASVLPSIYASDYVCKVEPNVIKMIRALGINFGVVFLQGFYEDGKVYMYDPGLRFPGSDFDIAQKQAVGFDCMGSFIHFALTGDIAFKYGDPVRAYMFNGKACVILSVAVRAGEISNITGFDEIARREEVCSAALWKHVGDVVENTGDVRQRAVEFCCLLPDRESISEFFKLVYDTLRITDKDGQDMIVSKLDVTAKY
jgi:biotin carboxylase